MPTWQCPGAGPPGGGQARGEEQRAGDVADAWSVPSGSADQVLQIILDLVRWARRRTLNILHPSTNLTDYLREGLHRHLPADIHRRFSGRVHLSLTRVADWENVLVSDFQSKEEVVDALLCSCFIPFYCGLIPPSFRGVRYVDGGLSNNVPRVDDRTTITVSPFYGESDIGPKTVSTNFLTVDFTSLNLRVCSENVYFVIRSLMPPSLGVSGGHALREAARDPGGPLSKICALLPVRALTYALLPCTLPVEVAFHSLRRLVLWVPHIPEDLPWLRWVASRARVLLLMHLFPAAR
ncbi:PREDICTED: patatin-like phospholipase domain-containing protein 3 [Condylura cristata]|uniref:patatin-like phospholipase domain-containing protein 3 n=1 Tax=Condylura cristata TaxID=143302 RepID=UPI0003345647|nr:PREDICTED: patatin-like phospholipase domain-containing protein 3 [Condylura cristata]